MEFLDSAIALIHIVFASLFVVSMAVMQIVTGPALSKISGGEEKQNARKIVMGRARPTMDFAIIVLTITAIYLVTTRWDMVGGSVWLMVKITFGIAALTIANLIHFYWRGKKTRLKEAGETEKLASLNKFTLFMEKVTLTCAAVTLLMGMAFNHF